MSKGGSKRPQALTVTATTAATTTTGTPITICATRAKTKPGTTTDETTTTPTTTTRTKTTKTTTATTTIIPTKQHHRMSAKMAATINSPQPKLQRTPVPLTPTTRWLSLSLLAAGLAVFTSSVCEAASIATIHNNNNESNNTNSDNMANEHALNYTRAWRLITRAEWGARTPNSTSNFTGPAPYVVLHHSYQPDVCRTEDACKASMRSMQNFHMDGHGWPDIGYSFAVGGDGNVYEARGYDVVGAHAPNYNSRSIGLLLIGNFVEKTPPPPMQQVAQDFIKYSIEAGHLREDYVLHGHRQVRNTECPGEALYAEMRQWPHWQEV